VRTLVVLPSYNEKENIVRLIQELLNLSPETFVCVVDDSSPDGTADVIHDFLRSNADANARVHLMIRSTKSGRGGAVRAGLDWGYTQSPSFDVFVEMDCDFSHEPKSIPQGIALIKEGYDVALGSRYPDGTIVGWPINRRVFSFFANTLARTLIRWSIADYTNGFRFYNKAAVKHLLSEPQKHTGYIYLSESLSSLLLNGFKVATFPIYFLNRQRGVSNTSLKEIKSAFFGLFSIAWNHQAVRRSLRHK
jgi:glycosyltransferase involved in cell wall biosynthesis